jgi:microsomal dipeptidase-like Zn-dependent dipeptidase
MVDLHCHYPMHLLARAPHALVRHSMWRLMRAPSRARLRALIILIAAHLLNDPTLFGRWRVSFLGLEKGRVKVVLSVLYDPFDELDAHPRTAPDPASTEHMLCQARRVEADLESLDCDGPRPVIVKSRDHLDEALRGERMAFVHCIEGGLFLGATSDEVRRNVATLAAQGVRYVTLAHLVWRQVASQVPVIPLLPRWAFDRWLSAPPGQGLAPLGRVAVEAMYRHGVLIDVSHMRQDALDETFTILDDLDAEHGRTPGEFPVIASHSAFRRDNREYNVTPDIVEKIARRDGVIGLILSKRPMLDGRTGRPRTLEQSIEIIVDHVHAIAGVTDSYDHVAIGTDLDGFAKPTLYGLSTADDMLALRTQLERRIPQHADKVLELNALRVLRTVLPTSSNVAG